MQRILSAVAFLFVSSLIYQVSVSGQQIGRGGLGQPQPASSVPPSPAQPPAPNPGLVLLNVSVTGAKNAAVGGLDRARFHVFEDGDEQPIAYFWEDNRPISVGFVFDASEFMGQTDEGTNVLRDASSAYLQTKKTEDEFFVVQISDTPQMIVSFSTDARQAPHLFPAIGETTLYDGIYLGLELLKEAANPRKALVVITGGGDHVTADTSLPTTLQSPDTKRTTKEDMLVDTAIKQNGQIYTLFVTRDIGRLSDTNPLAAEQVNRDMNVVQLLADVTGGRVFTTPSSVHAVESICDEIARGLRTQYLIGYAPPKPAADGKRHGVKIRVDSQPGAAKLTAWTRSGYYNPKEKAE